MAYYFNKIGAARCCCGKPACLYSICRPGTVPETIAIEFQHNGIIAGTPSQPNATLGDETMLRLAGSVMHLSLAYSKNSMSIYETGVCCWMARIGEIEPGTGLYAIYRVTYRLSSGFWEIRRAFCVRRAADSSIYTEITHDTNWVAYSYVRADGEWELTEFPGLTRPFQLVDCTLHPPVMGPLIGPVRAAVKYDIGLIFGICVSYNASIVASAIAEENSPNVDSILSHVSAIEATWMFCPWYETNVPPAQVVVEFDVTTTSTDADSQAIVAAMNNGPYMCDYCVPRYAGDGPYEASYIGTLNGFTKYGGQFIVRLERQGCANTFRVRSLEMFDLSGCGYTWTTGFVGSGDPTPGMCYDFEIPCTISATWQSWATGLARGYFSGTATVSTP